MSWDTLCLSERIDANPPSAIASVAMGVLLELRVADPMPPLDTPVVSHQLQQCFESHPDTRERDITSVKGFAITLSRGGEFNDPARAEPPHTEIAWSLLRLQRQGDVAGVAELMNRCQ
jgi:hypothetical protein